MMDIREKLVELLLAVDSVCNKGECGDCGAENCFIYRAADHLIRHGLTVQEWISVEDRLPQERVEVLVYHKNGYISLNSITPCFGHRWRYVDDRNAVTHWMPLPTPPKGE